MYFYVYSVSNIRHKYSFKMISTFSAYLNQERKKERKEERKKKERNNERKKERKK